MNDVLTPEQRKRNMSRIRSKDTRPELIVRGIVRKAGIGYRLHAADLPGKPDLVFRGRHKVIFVHGCFWHMHSCPLGRPTPKTNAAFWQEKRTRTVERDKANLDALHDAGWRTLIVWECELRLATLSNQIVTFLQED